MKRLLIALTFFAVVFGWGTTALAKEKIVVQTISNIVPGAQASITDSTTLAGISQPKLMMFYNADIITVSFLNANEAKVIFRVRSDKNAIVYSERSKGILYHNRLSTKDMKIGTYKAEIVKGNYIYEMSFNVL